MSSLDPNSSRNDDLQLPTIPSDDWEMNVFLKELADGLTDDDLKTMKHFVSGFHGTRKGVLESIKDPLDFFQHLRHRLILTRDNIVVLQAMLWHLGRKDLHNKFVKFAKKRGNIIHFYNSKDKPENGYEYLHFHVAGKEKMNRNKLEELRALVSRVLCVPSEFIVVTDIEATNSILITFMIPEGYSNIILELNDKDKEYLGSKGVDAVLCNGETINCIASHTTGQEESISKNEEVMLLLDQRSKADQELEFLQQQLLEKDKQIRDCQKSLQEIKQQVNWKKFEVTAALIQQYMEYRYTPKKCSLQDIALRNAYKYSSHLIAKAEKRGYNSDLIGCLIEANTIVVQSQSRSFHKWIETQQNNVILKLQQDVTELNYERDKLAYFLKVGTTNPVLTQNEEFFLKVLGMPMPLPAFRPNIKIRTEFGETDLETIRSVIFRTLQMMESYLSDAEREVLTNKCLPTSSEIKAFKDSKLKLLEYLWTVKEVDTKGPNEANFHEWMINVLTTIKRMDLLNTWITKSHEILLHFGSDINKRTATQSQTQHQTKEHNPNRIGRSKPAPAQSADSKTENKAVNERLMRLEEMMERNMKLTESIASGPMGQNPFRTPYPYGGTKLGADAEYDWSKLSQSKFFTKK